jgi:hypothetical protein
VKHYVLDGHEVRATDDYMEWAMWFEKADRRVARTDLIDGSWISTVFLGLDHNWGGGPPMLFETAVFLHEDTEPGSVSPFSGALLEASEIKLRYSTWAEAELGHFELCEKLAMALPAWKMEDTK